MDSIKNEITDEYNRILTYYDLLMANIGHIVGAGVFILIGYIVGIARGYAWVSVGLSGLIIYIVSNYYIKAHTIHPENGAEYLVIKDAFGLKISNIIITFIIISTISIAFVVAISCGDYIKTLIGIDASIGFIIVILLSLALNLTYIKYSTKFNNYITGLGLCGLGLLIVLGLNNIKQTLSLKSIKTIITNQYEGLLSFKVWCKIIMGAFIFLFAYYGFDTVIKLDAECINPDEDIPKAINNSIIFTIILYSLICIIIISIMTPAEASKTDTPLADLTKKLTSSIPIQKFIELCGVLLTFTTLLLLQTGLSRFIREFISKNLENIGNDDDNLIKSILKFFTKIHSKTKTPIYILIFITICIILMYLSKISVMTGAIIANSGIVIMCFMVVISVIIITTSSNNILS